MLAGQPATASHDVGQLGEAEDRPASARPLLPGVLSTLGRGARKKLPKLLGSHVGKSFLSVLESHKDLLSPEACRLGARVPTPLSGELHYLPSRGTLRSEQAFDWISLARESSKTSHF